MDRGVCCCWEEAAFFFLDGGAVFFGIETARTPLVFCLNNLLRPSSVVAKFKFLTKRVKEPSVSSSPSSIVAAGGAAGVSGTTSAAALPSSFFGAWAVFVSTGAVSSSVPSAGACYYMKDSRPSTVSWKGLIDGIWSYHHPSSSYLAHDIERCPFEIERNMLESLVS